MFDFSSEKGQVLVILTVGFVVLIGFTALAIDGGMVYADRRHAQNAADTASFAGAAAAGNTMESLGIYYATFDCTNFNATSTAAMGVVYDAIIANSQGRASSNDYTIDNNISDNHGVVAFCVDDENRGSYIEKYIDVDTWITRVTNTALIHFVYSGPVQSTVESIVRIRPRTPLAFGHAVVALNDAPCGGSSLKGVKLSGSSDTNINGGGIYSHGCLVCSGASFDADVIGGNVNYVGDTTCNAGHQVSPSPQKISPLPVAAFNVDTPDCSGLPNHGSTTISSGNYSPGIYRDINMNNAGDVVTLQPGLLLIAHA